MNIIGLLGVLFVGLKLAEIITWSWWLVLLPFYGATLAMAVLYIVVLFVESYKRHKSKGGR